MNSFEHENSFYQTCTNDRIAKLIAHYELYKMAETLPGQIVEAGVFKGSSLIRFATFREIFGATFAKEIIAFDSFGEFPATEFEDDQKYRQKFIDEAGLSSISINELKEIFYKKNISGPIELIEGNILETVAKYKKENPELRISLLNIDVDVYEPTKEILEQFYPLVVKGGIIIFDDYGVFPGANQAIEEFLEDKEYRINKFPFVKTPCWIVK